MSSRFGFSRFGPGGGAAVGAPVPITAIENPLVDCIGHLTGRLILRREPVDLDVEQVAEAAARTGTISVGNRTFAVSQAAGAVTPPACTYSIAPTSQNVGAGASTSWGFIGNGSTSTPSVTCTA